jgi:hypothetical protein
MTISDISRKRHKAIGSLLIFQFERLIFVNIERDYTILVNLFL